MPEEEKTSSEDKKVPRRLLLKWMGALGASAVVGAVAGYGASEFSRPVPPPPPPISLRPPLSPEIKERVDAITKQLMDKHAGEQIYYSTCTVNGCWYPCILKTRVKDGIITAFEADDTINSGMLREDAVIGMDAVKKEMIQARGCARGSARRYNIYAPTRLKYPMKRLGERGEQRWARITWEEALDTIANKMKELKEKYGPYFTSRALGFGMPFAPYAGFGAATFQSSSFSGTEFSEKSMLGGNPLSFWGALAGDGPDILNSKLIVGVGWNPAITIPEMSYWLTLAKEQGIPMIWIDPTYSVSAEAYANQWIPIRPGTDAAMLLAIANVLFKEDLYDKDYVSKFVEPAGFQKWRDYVLGFTEGEDGKIDRTPEWAEKICGVPAETIRDLARLYARSKPAYFRVHWAPARMLETDATAAAGIALQVMTGNVGVPGGWHNGSGIGAPSTVPVPWVSYNSEPPEFYPSTIWYDRGWADAVLLRPKLEKGEISEAEYRQRIGVAAEMPLPNEQMAWMVGGQSRHMVGNHDTNKVIRALKEVEFTVAGAWHINHPGILMADIVLPLSEVYWEDASYQSVALYTGTGVTNYFLLSQKCVQPPGEAKTPFWIDVQLAKRLGVADKWVPNYANVSDKEWDQVVERDLKTAYEDWAKRPDIAPKKPPSWEEFVKKPVYRVPLEAEPFVEYRTKITKNEPFKTKSGKIQFYSDFVASGDVATKGLPFTKEFTGVGDHCYGGSKPPKIPPMPQWHLQRQSIIGPETRQYPLMVLTSHSFYRQHHSQDNNPWLFPDECRHACWLSVADAKARDIKDNDLVRVHNDRGEMVLPAYVTSRLAPGTCRVGFGAWYTPSQTKTDLMPLGIDRRGAANVLTNGDHYPWIVGPVVSASLVQVEKF